MMRFFNKANISMNMLIVIVIIIIVLIASIMFLSTLGDNGFSIVDQGINNFWGFITGS